MSNEQVFEFIRDNLRLEVRERESCEDFCRASYRFMLVLTNPETKEELILGEFETPIMDRR